MKTFNYNPNLSNLTILKTEDEQFDKFFYQGHPLFLIPDFNPDLEDIWLSFLDYLEKSIGKPIYDQDGGEVTSKTILDSNTGLTKCIYEAYGINFDKDDDPVDIIVEIEGYVVHDSNNINGIDYYFVATKVTENSTF